MPAGLHWEWRGFGLLPDDVRQQIDSLEPQYDAPQPVIDEYLWVPGSEINLKLRSDKGGSLKFKRLREKDKATGLELWQERKEEDYQFPVPPKAVAAMGEALGVRLPTPAGPLGREELLEALRGAGAHVKKVDVDKVRRARFLPTPDGRVIVDVAEISTPERITSIGVEHEVDLGESPSAEDLEKARRAVLFAVRTLRLQGALQLMNYGDAVKRWATDGKILATAATSAPQPTRSPAPPPP